ncbi:MAG TPA: glycosyltransferase family A protein [Bacteroidia bacterium]|jgi:glycosyltransferase involved in cell wall biosynthesis|nr:glycosyltransferase family A protein [Bacteroidia bacterium]
MKYSIITPTRDEGNYIEQTILSVINQEVKPCEWFIMDDDSKDDTPAIVRKYQKNHPFIHYVHLIGFRPDLQNTGGRVAAILNHADSLRTIPTPLLARIDADTTFSSDFYRLMIGEFEKDPQLGIASGLLYEHGIPEKRSDWISGRGANILVRYTCFQRIGKFFESRTRGEDTLAFVAVRALGYKSCTFRIPFHHHKPEGIRKSNLKNHYITGFYKGSIPYRMSFFLGTVMRDLLKKPYFAGSLLQVYAYFKSRYFLRYKPFPDFVSVQLRKEQKLKIRQGLGL